MPRNHVTAPITAGGDGERPFSTPALALLDKMVGIGCKSVMKATALLADGASASQASREAKAYLMSWASDLRAAVVLGELEAFHDQLASAAEDVGNAFLACKERRMVMTHDLASAIERLGVVLEGRAE